MTSLFQGRCLRLGVAAPVATILALMFCSVPPMAAYAHAAARRSARPSAGGRHSLLSIALTIAVLVVLAAGLIYVYWLDQRHDRNPAGSRQRGD